MGLKVFLVEDEEQIAKFVALELRHEGFSVETEQDGEAAYARILEGNFDLVLLDWMLPGMEGIDICQKVREVSDVPIIMLTARGDVKERVQGLDMGADDYLTKPFAVEELLARIRAVLRKHKRTVEEQDEVLVSGNLMLIPSSYEVRLYDKKVDLTLKEFQILEMMLRLKNKVVTRQNILHTVWGYEYIGDTNIVDVYMSSLRQKLDKANNNKKVIFTVRGAGYVVKD